VTALAPLEVASGLIFGDEAGADPLPRLPGRPDPIRALEDATVPALARPPCLVAFSGGRDSAAILAVATRAARREGLEPPVPITVRFPADERTHEGEWQELVVRDLGLADWVRRDVGDELGVLGPVARRALAEHGVLWPPNVHLLAPLLEAARGGSLLTGFDGDRLFGGRGWGRLAGIASGRIAPTWRDLRDLARLAAPTPVRTAWVRRRAPLRLAWLRPGAAVRLNAAFAAEVASEPVRWRARVEWLARRRYLAAYRASAAALAASAGAAISDPFLDPRFLAALARGARGRDLANRDLAMRHLFAALLPAKLLARRDKAEFTGALWGADARSFAERWRGEGLSDELVESPALRRTWAANRPDFRSATALHAAWLHEMERRPEPLRPLRYAALAVDE
jgi:asparagine synthase (glutamine-hydrolysing)